LEVKRLSGGVPVEFDWYMRELVDKEVFFKGKKEVQVPRRFFSEIRTQDTFFQASLV
jgi:hypothetical protein